MSATPEVLRTKAEVTAIEMQGVVKGKDTPDSTWKEVVEISSFSATGAGFIIPRELKVGTIVAVMLPLAAHLRCYDHDKELYRVLGLIQHCQPFSGEGGSGFHVGVAFVGSSGRQSLPALADSSRAGDSRHRAGGSQPRHLSGPV